MIQNHERWNTSLSGDRTLERSQHLEQLLLSAFKRNRLLLLSARSGPGDLDQANLLLALEYRPRLVPKPQRRILTLVSHNQALRVELFDILPYRSLGRVFQQSVRAQLIVIELANLLRIAPDEHIDDMHSPEPLLDPCVA